MNSLKRHSLDILCVLVLILVPLFAYWSEATGKTIWAEGDFASYQVPMNTVASEQWRQGILPLWNPYMDGGTPLAAVQNPGVFYPVSILIWLLFPPWLALTYHILILTILTEIGTYLFLRSLNLCSLTAMLGGFVFAFSGFALSHLGHVMMLKALPCIGFALYGVNAWINTRQSRYLAVLTTTVSFLFFSGYPQIIVYASMLIGSYILFARKTLHAARLWAITAFLLGIGLSSVQIYPGISLWSTHEFLRPGEKLFDSLARFSFHPAYLITLLFSRARLGNYAETVAYIGILPLFLALIGGVTRANSEERRVKNFFLIWAGAALLLSFGRYIPFLVTFQLHIPLYGSFSVLSKHLMEFDFSLCVLSAVGLNDIIQRQWWRCLDRFYVVLMGLFAISVVLFGLYLPIPHDAAPLSLQPSYDIVLKPLMGFVFGAVLVIIAGVFRKKTPHIAGGIIFLLVVIDLVSLGVFIYPSGKRARPDFYKSPPPTAEFLRQHASPSDPFRIVSFEAPGAMSDIDLGKQLLAANYNVTYKAESMIGHEGLQLRRFNEALEGKIPPWGNVEQESIKDAQFRTMLNFYGVRYLLIRAQHQSSLEPFYPRVATIGGVSIFDNPSAKSRIFPMFSSLGNEQTVQKFGGKLTLLAYQVEKIESLGTPFANYVFKTWWLCNAPVHDDFTFYIHYLDSHGKITTLSDHKLGIRSEGSAITTSHWASSGYYQDEVFIPAKAAKKKKVEMVFGLWVPQSGTRLAASGQLPVDKEGGARLSLNLEEESKASKHPPEELLDQNGKQWFDLSKSSNLKTVAITDYRHNRIEADIDLGRDALLVHGTNYVSGWKARLDGKPVSLMRVDTSLQGILIPGGKHHVEFWYDPAAFWHGVHISLFCGGLLIILCWILRQRQSEE